MQFHVTQNISLMVFSLFLNVLHVFQFAPNKFKWHMLLFTYTSIKLFPF